MMFYMAAAYSIVLVAILLYLITVARRYERLREELDALKHSLDVKGEG